MEPRQSTPEQTPRMPVSPEVSSDVRRSEVLPNPEVFTGAALERESTPPVQPVTTSQDTALPSLPTPVPLPTPATAAQDDSSNMPLVAADEDLIEKEWVNKVKKVIQETKDDPYRREQEVKKVQIEYVRKRYGREIGDQGED